MYEGTIGIGICSSGRPDYLTQVLCHLEAQIDVGEIDVHLFQDGATNRFSGRQAQKPEDINACVRLFQDSPLPNKTTHLRDHNVSVAIAQLESYDFLCTRYKHIVYVEDDVLLSPYWIRLVRLAIPQIEHETDVLGMWPGMKRICSKGNIDLHRSRLLRCNEAAWTGYYMRGDRWTDRIRPEFMKYYAMVSSIDYRERDNEAIRSFLKKNGFNHPQTSQDAAKVMCIQKCGMHRLRMAVNRAMYIGEVGEHGTPGHYAEQNWVEMGEGYICADDAAVESFDIVSKLEPR